METFLNHALGHTTHDYANKHGLRQSTPTHGRHSKQVVRARLHGRSVQRDFTDTRFAHFFFDTGSADRHLHDMRRRFLHHVCGRLFRDMCCRLLRHVCRRLLRDMCCRLRRHVCRRLLRHVCRGFFMTSSSSNLLPRGKSSFNPGMNSASHTVGNA